MPALLFFILSLQLKHQRKDDIDATRGGFELPTNSNTVTH